MLSASNFPLTDSHQHCGAPNISHRSGPNLNQKGLNAAAAFTKSHPAISHGFDTINQLLDGLKLDYTERHIWNERTEYIVGKTDSEIALEVEAFKQGKRKWKPKLRRSLSLREYFGKTAAVELTKKMVTQYRVKMQETYADSSINRHVQILLQAFTIADRVPPKIKRLSEIGNERKGFFERADFLKLLLLFAGFLPVCLPHRLEKIRNLKTRMVGRE